MTIDEIRMSNDETVKSGVQKFKEIKEVKEDASILVREVRRISRQGAKR